MSPFPKTKPPVNAKVLDTWLRDHAAGDDEQKNRRRRGISFVIVAAVLGELRDDDATPLFILKGGVPMLLRFGRRTRLSADEDAVFRREMKHLEAVLAEAVRHPVGGFTVRAVGKPVHIGPTDAFRQQLKISFRGKPWGQIPLEVSRPEGRSADPAGADLLDPDPDPTVFGLDPVGPFPCLSVRYQIAQKLHACTDVKGAEGSRESPNTRSRDLLDLLLLEELVEDGHLPDVRAACVEVFTLRAKHAWPPRVTVYAAWPDDYRRLAEENAFPVTDVYEAVERVHVFIARIDEAAGRSTQDE